MAVFIQHAIGEGPQRGTREASSLDLVPQYGAGVPDLVLERAKLNRVIDTGA